MGGTGRPLGKTFFLQCQRRHPERPKIPTYLPTLAPMGSLAVDSRLCSRWCDVHCRVLRWEEVLPRPPCHLLSCVWPLRDLRRACVAVRRRCRSQGRLPLRALGGFPPVALKPVWTPVAIFGSGGVCVYVPGNRHSLISYCPIDLI